MPESYDEMVAARGAYRLEPEDVEISTRCRFCWEWVERVGESGPYRHLTQLAARQCWEDRLARGKT